MRRNILFVLLVSGVFAKGVVFPSWISCVELLGVFGLIGLQWYFEPKQVEPPSKEETKAAIENLAEQISQITEKTEDNKAQIGNLRLGLGYKRGR